MHIISVRVNIFICVLFIYGHAEVAHKRLPMGFQGMRGKKNVDMSTLDDLQDTERPLSLTRLQNYLLTQQPDHYSFYKRAPAGFMGMRGKKEDMYSGSFYQGNLPEDLYEFDSEEKRGLKGFQGMRGKKQIEYPILSYPNKRKPMGFLGMRGKKSNIDDLLNIYDPNVREGEANTFLTNLPTYGSPYFEDTAFADDDLEKRGLKGFQGMRGKREFDFDSAEQSKRAPSGFMGMRGKKDDLIEKSEQPIEVDQNVDNAKETGMKEVVGTTILPIDNLNGHLSDLDNFGNGDTTSNNMNIHAVKRSPNFGFYGVRGKKMPYLTSYFGTRGKKGPFDYSFRGKFVGVRGKKSDAYQQYADRLSWAEEYQKRTGPSGFLGMRGKKSITPDDMFAGGEDVEE